MKVEAADVRSRILLAGEEVFAESGYSGGSLLRIAKRAGTSESGILRFFDTKQAVYLAVMEAALDHLHEKLDRTESELPSGRDAVEELVSIARTIFDCYESEPNKISLIFTQNGLSIAMLKGVEGRTLLSLPGTTRLVERFAQPFRRGTADGTFPDTDPVVGRELFFGMIEGTILGWILSEGEEPAYPGFAPSIAVLAAMRRMLAGLRGP